MSEVGEQAFLNGSLPVLHWYDFLCPFCYVAQHRNEILRAHGVELVELPFQAHPDIPPEGMVLPARSGPMYASLELEATRAGLPLHWPRRLPNTRQALAAAEWVRQNQPRTFPQFRTRLFQAHFALGEDLGSLDVIDGHARESGVDLTALHAALADGSAMAGVAEAEMAAREVGVEGTPAWLFGEQLVSGLLPAAEFERLARARIPE
jgi:predicted DsbA family dithiol-disulfide isomerase